MTNRPRALIAAVTAVLALGAGGVLAGCASPVSAADDEPAARTVVGVATGSVDGVPDTLTVTMGVDTRAGSAQEAMTRNAARAAGVINALKLSGVDAKDLQTSQLSVHPTFDNRGRINGYAVSNVVTARLRGIEGAGAVIDAAAGQAGDDIRVHGIALSIEDTGPLMARARADAVRRARAQAGQLARAAGVRLGAVRRITEERSDVPMPVAAARMADESALSSPIEPGSQELTVEVAVVYEIGDR